MNRICIRWATALAFAVFGAATALAQSTPAASTADFDNNGRLDVSVVLPGDRQEEVEILRRLLDDSFHAVYGYPRRATLDLGSGIRYYSLMGPAQLAFSPDGARLAVASPDYVVPLAEGVYLKDYGVVYTVTLPSPPNAMPPGPTAGVVMRTPLSPWERTRKELRGEKIEDEGKVVSGSPSLSDVILKVLADNGKHFTRLAEGERITVAVTFRDDAANGIYHHQRGRGTGMGGEMSLPGRMPQGGSSSPGGLPAGGSVPPGMGSPGSSGRLPGGLPSGGSMSPSAGSSQPAALEGDAAWQTDVRNGLTLGDLHLKQQNYPAALAAYKNAQVLLQKAFDGNKTLNTEDAGGVLTAAHLYLNLAKGYESAGDNEASRKAMQYVGSLSKLAAKLIGEAPEAPTAKAQPALPSKLVVTASKKLLEEVGAGKMTFEAFRKAATVESVKPPAADKK